MGDVRPSERRLQGYTYAIQTLRNATACVALTGTMLTAFTVTMTYLRTVKAELEWLVLLQFSSTGLLLLFSLSSSCSRRGR